MSTTVYNWDELPPQDEFIFVVKDCPRSGITTPSRLENCKDCAHLFGFEQIPRNDPDLWEYSVVCRAPLSRSVLKVR